VFDYAGKLLSLHASRETSKGFAFAPDNKWQQEFERSFLYKETADQLTAIAATKADMESERPMDRLICGDVGFGKTEVAIRAAFKAVMNGKQVALLVPTTVLAQQHYQNFRERMSDYPVVIEMLSRFRTQAEQRKVIKRLQEGSVDIVIGTHRLTSGDVQFKDLGLVVIDEEQRFGVRHKEKFKELFKLVDVLTLSATPIPRTLYLSLMGAKDMSTLETPPSNRIPTETIICPYDERVIREAIRRELQRQGQVYFLHNRVQSIERIADKIRLLCPDARVEIGHGQMDEDELEVVMQRFIDGKSDVLVSTTIIESGLDIPNANTIIIDRADRFGLADLYQLRGRVGRAQHKAYAYLMLPRDMMTVGEARKRINAIKQYSSLGAGFKIAMRDLEIRGAGNILGTAQSGHILAIGFDLYCQLLKQAIAKLKGEKVKPRVEVVLRLDFVSTNEAEWTRDHRDSSSPATAPAFLPVNYIAEPQTRIQAYRKLAEITANEQLDQLRKSWRDRFGPLPDAVENLLLMTEIKLAGSSRRFAVVEVREEKLMLTRGGDFVLMGGKFPRLTADAPEAKLREVLLFLRSF
jgi:transcription-repair coupling factor (superfamily II helicase)